MSVVWRAAGIVVTAASLALLLKKDNPAFSFLLGVASLGAVLLLASSTVGEVVDAVWRLQERTGLRTEELAAVLKALGIGLVTRVSADLCEEAGQKAAGSAVEFCGAAAILLAALPLIRRVLDRIGGML